MGKNYYYYFFFFIIIIFFNIIIIIIIFFFYVKIRGNPRRNLMPEISIFMDLLPLKLCGKEGRPQRPHLQHGYGNPTSNNLPRHPYTVNNNCRNKLINFFDRIFKDLVQYYYIFGFILPSHLITQIFPK